MFSLIYYHFPGNTIIARPIFFELVFLLRNYEKNKASASKSLKTPKYFAKNGHNKTDMSRIAATHALTIIE